MENKEILLKELSSRLSHDVKLSYKYKNHIHILSGMTRAGMVVINDAVTDEITTTDIENVKPYLFPLSTLTEELKTFIRWKLTLPFHETFDEESLEDLLNNNIQVVNFCYENHIDINGLIEKGLAIDATDKNIY